MKFSLIAPSMMTVCNLSSGFVSIVLTSTGFYKYSAVFVLLAALFDCLDGKVARWLHAESHFGKELDSLADIVSFGAAPAFLLASHFFMESFLFIIPCLVFVICGALRLARYNIKDFSGVYEGVPITVAGIVIVVCTMLPVTVPDWGYTLILIGLGGLMVGKLRVPKI